MKPKQIKLPKTRLVIEQEKHPNLYPIANKKSGKLDLHLIELAKSIF